MIARASVGLPVSALLSALLVAPGSAAAQQNPPAPEEQADTFELEELVVTASRAPQPVEAVTAEVTTLDGEELRARGVDRVMEALRTVPGAAVVESGSFGGTTSLYMRGGESDYVQVLVDGVPVNRPGGSIDFAGLTMDNVERIEVVRGPASVLYGSDAVSGVVQVFTRRGRGEPSSTAAFRAGSYGSVGWDATVSGGAGAADYSFAASRFATDGIYEFNSDYRNTVLSGRVRLRADSATEADLAVRYTDDEFHYPTNSAGEIVDRNAFDFEDAVTLSLDLTRSVGDRLRTRLSVAAHEVDAGFDDRADGPADTLGTYGYRSLEDVSRRTVDLQASYEAGAATVLTAGAELERQGERSFNRSLSSFGESTGSFDRERGSLAYYVEALTRIHDALSLNLGARLDDSEAFGTFTTYRAGAAYTLPTGTRVRASLGTGFKEPTFLENYARGFTTGNPDLEPERSRSWEAGLEQRLADGSASVSIAAFDQDFRDLIQYTASPPEPGEPNFFNVAEAGSRGIEAGARLRPAPALDLTASYTWLDTETRDAGFDSGPDAMFVDGEPLLRRPTHAAGLVVGYRPAERLRLNVDIRYTGERADRDFSAFPAVRVTLPAYTRVDLGGEYDLPLGIGPDLTLTLRVDNALNAEYQEIVNFPARGRTVFLGGRVGLGS